MPKKTSATNVALILLGTCQRQITWIARVTKEADKKRALGEEFNVFTMDVQFRAADYVSYMLDLRRT